MKSEFLLFRLFLIRLLFIFILLPLLGWSFPSGFLEDFARLRGITLQSSSSPQSLAKRTSDSSSPGNLPGWETPYYAQGPAGPVYSLAISDDQTVAAGRFYGADTVQAHNVALWTGSKWTSLGKGLRTERGSIASVLDLASAGSGGFYAAGLFDSAGAGACRSVAHWTGAEWKCLGFSVDPLGTPAAALAVMGNQVYAGGWRASGVYRWNGSGWDTLGPVSGAVSRLKAVGTELWVGGEFSVKGDTSTLNLIRGNGSVWTGFGNKIGPVRDFAVSGTDVFVIETFRTASRIDTQTVQHWNGSSWSRVDLDFPKFEFNRVVTDSQNVYLFGTGLNDLRLHVFKWDGARFVSILAETCFGTASAVEVRGNRIVLGGQFSGIGGMRADNLAVWYGSSWKALTLGIGAGPSMNGEVMASNGQALFLGGRNIRWSGKQPLSGIGRFDGAASEGMAGGFKDLFPYKASSSMTIKAIAFDGSSVLAGGRFDSSQSGPAGNVARWNGSAWSGLGEGYPGLVHDLVVQNNAVLLAGKPDSLGSGGAATLRGQAVGRWNGSLWESLGGGLGGEAYKFAVFKGDVYVGGKVRAAPTDSFSGIMRLAGNRWSALPVVSAGEDLDSVFGMAVLGEQLFLLAHTRKAAPSMQSLWKWDGQGLSLVASITHATGLIADDKFLYVSMQGSMQSIDALWGSTLARWSPSEEWQSLTDGISLAQCAMAIHGEYLYVNARISGFEGKPAFYMVRWKRSGVNGLKHLAGQKGHIRNKAYMRFGALESWEWNAVSSPGGPSVFDLQGRTIPSQNRMSPDKTTSGVESRSSIHIVAKP